MFLGWLILNLLVSFSAIFINGGTEWLSYTLVSLFYTGMFTLAGWVVVAFPLFVLLSPASSFWRWSRCPAVSAAVGAALILGLYLFLNGFNDPKLIVYVLIFGAIPGAIPGAIAMLTRRLVP